MYSIRSYMTPYKKKIRTARVAQMNVILKELFPNPVIALNYGNNWELVVAVQLSAQCTDERVNRVTEKLFKKYTHIRAYADATQEEMERMVFSCGFYRNKAKNIRNAARAVLDSFGE